MNIKFAGQKSFQHFYDYLSHSVCKTTKFTIVKHTLDAHTTNRSCCKSFKTSQSSVLQLIKFIGNIFFVTNGNVCVFVCLRWWLVFGVNEQWVALKLFVSMHFKAKQSKEKSSHDNVPVLFCFSRSNPVRCDPIQNKVSKLPYLKHLPNHSCDYCQRKIGHFVFFCWNNKCHWYFKQKCIEMQTIRKVLVVSNHQPNCNRNCKRPSAISHQ